MQSGSMGDEDSAEWNDICLMREAEVSVGSTRMLLTEMGQLNESFGEKLETYKQRTEEFSQEMAHQITLREREKDLMTNELRASTEARKQLSEIINGIRVFIETEKGIMTKELESFREAVTQHLQEMNELRETEKGIMTKELKSFREAVTQHLQEMNEMRASSSNKFDEPDASRSTLFRKIKGLFGSSKSTRQGRRSLRKTQKKHKVDIEASLRMPLLASQSHEDQLEYVQEHDKITDSLEISGSDEVESGSTASSGRCEAGPSLVKNTDSGKRHDKVMDSRKGSKSDGEKQSSASLRMPLLASQSHEDQLEYVQEHDKITDSLEISGSDEVESGSTGRITTRGVYHGTDDGYVHFYEQVNHDPSQCTGCITTQRAYHRTDDDYIHFCRQERTRVYHDPSQCTGQLSPSRPAQSLPLLPYEMDIRDLPNERTRVYHDPSQCTGQLSPSRPAQSLPLLSYEMDIRDLPNVIERLKNYEGQLLSFRSAESPSSLQHEIDIRDLPNQSGIKIEQQPKSKKQPEGSEVIFELKVQEQDRYSYQWLKDGAELEGKCDAILILDNVELHQFGWYICRVRSRENFRINCESSRAWLDVVPKVQKGTTLLSSSKRRYALLEFSKQPSYTRNYPRKDMQATLSICLLIFGVCLQGDLCESNKICHGKQYTVKSADGNFEKCQPCGVCNEGWGLEPKCGSTVISPVNETYCQRCHDGITYSDTYDSSPCYMCQHCAQHEIVKTSCTSDTNTKCSGTCEYGYYYNAQDASHACHECSHCCSDGKDEIQTECVRHGLEKRHCSLRMDTNCGPTIKPSISSNTGDSGKFKPIYILYICIGALVGVIILLVAVLLKRRNAGQNNLSVNTNPEQGIKQHEAQPMIHINGRVDPQLDNSNLTTPTQSGKYNHESTQVSSGTKLHPVVSELNPGYAHSNAGTPRVSPKGTPDLSRQQDGQIKIIQHPKHQKQKQGLRVEFSCKCEVPGGTQVSYQWLKDDQELEGKTSDTLLLDSVRIQDFGLYRCQVSRSGDTGMEPVKSEPAELIVTPGLGKKLKTLRELKFDTKNQVAMLLENTAPGVGGWKEVAHRYGMNKDLVKNLETKQDPGTQVMDFLQASKPDLQVYSFCKTLKEKNCFNIVKVLEDELVN